MPGSPPDRSNDPSRGGDRDRFINISPEARDEMLGAASAGRMSAEVHNNAQRTPVNLGSPTDLQAHLISAHEWEDYDFHRNSNWHGEALDKALGPNRQDDDYRMSHSEIRRVHHFEHGAYGHDYPSAVTMEDEHFHE